MGNPFCHVELQSNDPTKAKEFYKGMFDWGMEEMPMGETTYTMIQVGEGTGGGIMKNPVPNVPSHWLAYILFDDVAASTDKARSLGGNVLMDKIEIPNVGWFSVIQDPTGAAIGLWQQKAKE